MYNFIIDEFENSKPPRKEEGKKQHSLEGKRRKSIITIFEQSGGFIYTDEEIEEMRRQAESVSQNPKTVIAPETTEKSASGVKGEIKADSKKMERAAIDLQEGGKTEEYGEREVDSEKVSSKGDVDEQENGEEGNSKSKEQELEELKAKITSYGDIGKMIKGFIAEGRIEDAIKYGKYFMNNSDFLTKIEKDNLFVLIEYMKSIKTQHFQPRCMREISDEEEMR